MKLSSVITTIALFTGVFSQATTQNTTSGFNATSLNGTWYVEGVEASIASALATLSQVANITISCPQILVAPAENSTVNNTLYVQPLLRLDWFNSTSQSQEKTNITLSGLMTLNSTDEAGKEAKFNVSLAVPEGIKQIMASDDSLPTFDADAFKAGNISTPFPNGTDFTGMVDVKFGSSNGSDVQDVMLFKAYDFNAATNATTLQKRDDDEFYAFLRHENATAVGANFTTIVTALGGKPEELTQFNYTCSA